MDPVSKAILDGLVPKEELTYQVIQFYTKNEAVRNGVLKYSDGLRSLDTIISSSIISVFARRGSLLFNWERILSQNHRMFPEGVNSFIYKAHLSEYGKFKELMINLLLNNTELKCYGNRALALKNFPFLLSTIRYNILRFSTGEDTKSYAKTLFEDNGYIHINYYEYINMNHPFYSLVKNTIYAPKLTPEIFESYAGPWSISDGEELALSLSTINGRNSDNVKAKFKEMKTSGTKYMQFTSEISYSHTWTKYNMIRAIIDSIPQSNLKLSIITGNPSHSNVVLPGFKIRTEGDDERFYPSTYYKLVYRRAFNTLKYSSGFIPNMNLNVNLMKCMKDTYISSNNLLNAPLSFPSWKEFCDYVQANSTPTQEEMDKFALSWYDVKRSSTNVRKIDIDSIISSAPAPPQSRSLNGIPQKLLNFLRSAGMGGDEIVNANSRRNIEDLRPLHLKMYRKLSSENLAELGFPGVDIGNMDEQAIVELRKSALERAKLFNSITHYGGNPRDFATMENQAIKNYIITQIGPNILSPGVVDETRIPTFKELLI